MKITSAEFIKGIRGTNAIMQDGVPQVAFLGRSNVGKSSTINALTGRKSLVKSSATPGKTKEINFFKINNEFYFVDLPGYGYARVSQKAREKLRKLILWYIDEPHPERTFVLVLDAQVGVTEFDQEIIDALHERDESVVLVANKTDKLNQKDRHQAMNSLQEIGLPVVPFSAKTKRGAQDFFKAVFE